MSISIKKIIKPNIFVSIALFFVISAFLHSTTAATRQTPTLLYRLCVDEEFWQQFHVNIVIENVTAQRIVLGMPKWMPGAYILLNFGDKVSNFTATDYEDDALSVTQLSFDKWEVDCSGKSNISIVYDVTVSERRFMGKAMDSTGALIQGPATWMYAQDYEHLPIVVKLDLPESWQVATGLAGGDSVYQYRAANYDELADSPISMGHLREHCFYHRGKPHTVSIRGEGDFNEQEFVDMIKRIVVYQTDLFRETPYERYTFLFTLYPGEIGGGGLEHANSTTIGLSSLKLMQDVESAANVIAHEFFHLWNVKRIRPNVFWPFDYDKEARTKALWFCEGVTSYYADVTLVRTGIWSEEKFFDNQEHQIECLQENPDHTQTSVEQASWKSWEEGYTGQGISYYTKGQIVGLLLDLTIRDVTNNTRSLDDVMRFMNWWYAKQNRGYCDEEIETVVNAIVQTDLSFFDRYVSGTVELPYQEVFRLAGLNASIQATQVPDIGRLRVLGKRHRVFGVDANSPAGRAGLRRGDFIISVDGDSIETSNDIVVHVENKSKGDTLVVVAKRNGAQINFNVIIGTRETIDCEITRAPKPNERQKRILESWLKGEPRP